MYWYHMLILAKHNVAILMIFFRSIMRQSTCLVISLLMVYSSDFLFNCMGVLRVNDDSDLILASAG